MFDRTTTAIHGIQQAETPDGAEVAYVYPGALTAKLAEGVTMPVSSGIEEVELGFLMRDQDPLVEASWRWEADIKPATRRWAQHVLAASMREQNVVYEHKGEVVVIWAFIPARADELALLAAGFMPAMASWRAPANDANRALAAQMAARRPGPPTSALGEASPPSPMAADREDRMEWPEHTWMRWAALTGRDLSFGNKRLNLRKQVKYGDDLVLRYTGRNCEFELVFGMAQHPLIYAVTIRGKIDHTPFSRVIPSVAWEDFEALFTEIGRIVKVLPAAPHAENVPLEEARSALKALDLPPKKYAYYLRRAEEAIKDGKAYSPVVARARRVAEKQSGVTNPARPAAKPPKDPPDARVPAVDVTLDSFNAQPGWRVQQVRSRANGFVLAVFPEGRDMDAAVASVDVVDGEIDEVRWLDERVTQSVRDSITDRLERALWAAYGDEDTGDDEDAAPRPSPLQDLIDLMERRSQALGARAVNTADLGRKDDYANLASALRDLARPTGPTAEELQRWLETAELMSAGEVVGRARGAGPTSVRQIMRDLWAAVFEVITREQVAGRPGALRVSAEAIFHDDDNAGDFVLQRIQQGDREVVRRVRVRVGELDEDTDEVQVEDPTERLTSGAIVHRAERPEQFFIDLYGKLGAFHDDLERAPRTLEDVRTLLHWAAVMLDAPLCQGDVKARAAAAFSQAKAFYDTARRALIEGRSVDAVRRMHEALARISAAAAELARSCAEGQLEIAVTPPQLPVLPADKAAINGVNSLRWRDDEPLRRPPRTPAAPLVAMQAHQHVAGRPPAVMASDSRPRVTGQKPTRERLDLDAIAAEYERRLIDKEGEVVATMDRLARIYSGGRLAGRRVRAGTIVVERVNSTSEFPSLVLPNLASLADGFDVGAALAIVGPMLPEVMLAGWAEPGGKPTPDGDRLAAALEVAVEAYRTEQTSEEEFEATRDAIWKEAEAAGVAIEMAWRLHRKRGPSSREPAVATSLPLVPVRAMPQVRYLLELYLRQIPSDARASVISRWVRPPHDHIEAGRGAWESVLGLFDDHSTCSQCPFVLGSNLDCASCRTWVLALKRPGAPWTAERIAAAIYNCDEPAVATAAVEALAQSTQAPLTAAFFREFADNLEVHLTKHLDRPEDMKPRDRDHCRKAVEWLLPRPDFPLPEYPPNKRAARIASADILMRAAPVSARWRY